MQFYSLGIPIKNTHTLGVFKWSLNKFSVLSWSYEIPASLCIRILKITTYEQHFFTSFATYFIYSVLYTAMNLFYSVFMLAMSLPQQGIEDCI